MRGEKADLRCTNPRRSSGRLKSSLCQSRVFFIAILGAEKPRLVISLPLFFTTSAVDRSGHRERCFCFDARRPSVFLAHAAHPGRVCLHARRFGSCQRRRERSVTAVGFVFSHLNALKCPTFACLTAARRWNGWRRDCPTSPSRRRVGTCSVRWIMKS